MTTYIRKDDDVRYRLVGLKSTTVPPFKSFVTLGEGVSYGETQVIEVEDKNGQRTIYYSYPKLCEKGPAWGKGVSADGSRVTINPEITPARLWVNVKGALYKIPTKLPEDNGSYYFDMPLKPNDFDIEGDEYFQAAYGAKD